VEIVSDGNGMNTRIYNNSGEDITRGLGCSEISIVIKATGESVAKATHLFC